MAELSCCPQECVKSGGTASKPVEDVAGVSVERMGSFLAVTSSKVTWISAEQKLQGVDGYTAHQEAVWKCQC